MISIRSAHTPTIEKRLLPLIGLVIIAHVIVLFVVIPKVNSRLTPLYNQDRFMDGYDLLASSLVKGNGFRFSPATCATLMREPGYPIVLAGLFLIVGNVFIAVKLMNMCLALATAWLIMCLTRRLSNSKLAFIIAPSLFLLHPGTLIAESRGGVEALFTPLIVLYILLAARAMEREVWWMYAVAGGVLGLTVLVKSTPIMFPAVLLMCSLAFGWPQKYSAMICRHIAIMTFGMVLVLSPWIVRNYLLTKRFVPTASVLGVSAQAGRYICTHLGGSTPWLELDREASRERNRLAGALGYRFDPGYYQLFYRSEDEVRFSSYLLVKVIDEYRKAPLLCAKCVAYNIFNFWFAGKSRVSVAVNLIVQLPYLVLCIWGAILGVRNRQAKLIRLVVLFMVYFMAVYIPILSQARYSVPLVPFVSVLAAAALAGGSRCVAIPRVRVVGGDDAEVNLTATAPSGRVVR